MIDHHSLIALRCSSCAYSVQLVIILCALLRSASSQAPCYYPGGVLIGSDTPCQPNEPHSMCCGPSDICLSNGLCYVASINRLHRASCTDASWGSGSCIDICISSDDASLGWADVSSCPNETSPLLWHCGYGDSLRCQLGISQKTFNLRDGYFADPRNATLKSESSQTSSTTALVTGVSPTSSNVPSTTVNIHENSNTSNSGSSSISSLNNSTHHEFCPSRNRLEAGIGAGVGVSLALSLATALTLFFRERRSRRKQADEYRNALIQVHHRQEEQTLEHENHHQFYEADTRGPQNLFEAPAA